MAWAAGQKFRPSMFGDSVHCAQYINSAAQNFTTATATVVSLDTANRTSSYVTRSAQGAGHKFTLNASGIWAISGVIRWGSGGSASGSRRLALVDSLNFWFDVEDTPGTSAGSPTCRVSTIQYFSAGDYLYLEAYQDSGITQATGANVFQQVPCLNLALLFKDA